MKCKACGYDEEAHPAEGKFVKVSGYYTITREGDGYHQPPVDEVDVLACPKCGTLRIHHWSIRESP